MHTQVYIVDAVRTPIGSFGGSLKEFTASHLGSIVVKAILKRTNLPPEDVDEVIFGNVLQAGSGMNVARQIQINAGIPVSKTSLTVNMVCGSGLRSIAIGYNLIRSHEASVIIAGGTESMSNAPYLLKNARWGYRLGNGEIVDHMVYDGLTDIFNGYHMGITAENLAEIYSISRKEQDEFALRSQQKAEAAIKGGRFKDEIISVEIPQKKGDPIIFDTDEYPRFQTTLEKLSSLKPAFKKDGTVTAGNASGINDGASAVLIVNEDALKKYNLTPMARIVSYGYAGVDPAVMGIGPVEAIKLTLEKAGWRKEEVDLWEINEAFAVQSLAVIRGVGIDESIVNVNGGAIALGHPIGASGTRITTTLLHEMRKRKVKKGISSLCIGGGMGIAMAFELL